MLKYIGGACAIVLLCGAFFMTAGCGEGNAMSLFGKSEYIVGKDITQAEFKEFYYTISSSTNPPEFQRYRLTNNKGKYSFYHEKREGNVWPLTEKHITVSGTVELNDKQWQEFWGYLKDGKVTKRVDDPRGGGRGPWLFMYWNKDKDSYQVFKFADYGKSQSFEKLCVELKAKDVAASLKK